MPALLLSPIATSRVIFLVTAPLLLMLRIYSRKIYSGPAGILKRCSQNPYRIRFAFSNMGDLKMPLLMAVTALMVRTFQKNPYKT